MLVYAGAPRHPAPCRGGSGVRVPGLSGKPDPAVSCRETRLSRAGLTGDGTLFIEKQKNIISIRDYFIKQFYKMQTGVA
ncbi:hypothetical protein A0U91_05465 [Acetobacter persici]|uniref:Uncharacterized protein n=1 Tax=Acetobacter persici TaxID=1076596 RepID=A0A1U9LDI5_9PROT|nr:hypothetical protein A0U91_05465 [Acetobacter persici]